MKEIFLLGRVILGHIQYVAAVHADTYFAGLHIRPLTNVLALFRNALLPLYHLLQHLLGWES